MSHSSTERTLGVLKPRSPAWRGIWVPRSRPRSLVAAWVSGVAVFAALAALPLWHHRTALEQCRRIDTLPEVATAAVMQVDTACYEDSLRIFRNPPQASCARPGMFTVGRIASCPKCKRQIPSEYCATRCPCCRNWNGRGDEKDYAWQVAFCRDFLAASKTIAVSRGPGLLRWATAPSARRTSVVLSRPDQVGEVVSNVHLVAQLSCGFDHSGDSTLEMVFHRSNETMKVLANECSLYVRVPVAPGVRDRHVSLLFETPGSLWKVLDRHAKEFYAQDGR